MVRPSQERQTQALTDAQSVGMGDGTYVGDEDVDFPDGGTNPGSGADAGDQSGSSVTVISDSSDWDQVIDYSESRWWDITLTDDLTYAVTGAPASGIVGRLHIVFRQGSGAPWEVTHPAEVLWPDEDGVEGGSAPTLRVLGGALDVIVLTTFDGGTTWGGTYDGISGNVNDTSYEEVAATGATETIDVSVARTWDLTLDTSCTLSLTGAVNNEAWFATVIARQTTGAETLTWPGSVIWPGGVTPTLSTDPAGVDVFTLFSVDGGSVWFGFPTGGSGGGSAIEVLNEGVSLTSDLASMDFVGAGVTASVVGDDVTVTIPGGTTASDANIWRPLMDGAGNVVTDGTGQAVMAYGPA